MSDAIDEEVDKKIKKDNEGTNKVVVTIVLDQENKTILIQKGNFPKDKIAWMFPGGKVKPGELSKIAATRELFEKTGITVTPDKLVHLGRQFRNRHIASFYTCRVVSFGTFKKGTSIKEIGLFDIDKLDEIIMLTYHRDFLRVLGRKNSRAEEFETLSS